MAVEVSINAIDLEKDIALGLDLPIMGKSGALFQLNYLSIDQALANAKNLLLTDRGERVMHPTFGCDLKNILFENLNDDLAITVEGNIARSFNYWLPYIFINKVTTTINPDNNTINISLTISLKNNQIDTRTIDLVMLDSINR